MNSEDRRLSEVERDAIADGVGLPTRDSPLIAPPNHPHLQLVSEHSENGNHTNSPSSLLKTPSSESVSVFRSREQSPYSVREASQPPSNGSSQRLPPFGGGKEYPPPLPDRNQYIVEFEGPRDPMHPQNWPTKKKIVSSVCLAFVALVASFGSSVYSAATSAVAKEFGVSTEVSLLGISLYVLGFATGPILWAPFSELYGRKPPLLVSSFLFGIFHIAVSVGKDLQTVLICRFFAGFMGACPLTVVAAVYADMYDNRFRGVAITAFSMAVFCGPLLSPFIGGFITMSYLGWRWTGYITAIMGFFGLVLEIFIFQETYPPIILVQKAADLRRLTKNWGIHAKQEELELDLNEILEKNLSRPLRMLFTEPIVLALSIYMAIIYGLLYLFLEFYPIVFQQIYGMNEGVGGLPYFGMIVGELSAGILIILDQPSYNRKLAANGNQSVPEWRLPYAIVGGVAFSGGLFWFGWTGYNTHVHWIVPTISGLLTGFGILAIFQQCLNYIIDAYLMFAASAVAANTFLRSIFGAVFPLFATYMINGLGVQWAGTLLGCVAVVLVPLPILFYNFGPAIRAKSRFAPTPSPGQASASDDDLERGSKTE